MSAVVETSFFRPRNVEFSNSKLDGEERGEGGGGGVDDANRAINSWRPKT